MSLEFPSSLSYDAWSWVIWGRQVEHLHLVTAGGPSWKPLPVLLTTLLARFGSAAPNLWLIVARAGGLLALALAFELAFRLTRRRAPGATVPVAAGVLAGLIAAAGLLALSQYVNDVGLGDSEGLLAAFTLLAILRHLDGARRQALVLCFAACLDRPEAWPFAAIYAISVWRADPAARRLVVGLGGLLLALWFVPELWGSGSLDRGVLTARHPLPGAASFASCPFCTEITAHAWPLVLTPFKLGAAAVLVAALVAAWTQRPRPARRDVTVLAIGAIGIGWLIEDAVMTEFGFSGNNRYLLAPAALIVVLGAVGWGAAFRWLGERLTRIGVRPVLLCAAAVLVPAGVAIASQRDPDLIDLRPPAGALVYQAELRADLGLAVARAGGPADLLACGTIQTNRSEVPLMAWTLGVPLRSVEYTAGEVIVQSRNAAGTPAEPAVPRSGRYRLIAEAGLVKIYAGCR